MQIVQPVPEVASGARSLDRRALWLSLGGGTVSGLVFVWDALAAALTHQPRDFATKEAGEVINLLLGLFLTPLLVSLLSRRYFFLWALLALGVNLFWSVTDRLVLHNWPGLASDLVGNGIINLDSALIVAGPVSLSRWQLRLSRERAERAAQAYRALVQTEEGVWPPPPNRPTL